MARPSEYDLDQVLNQVMEVFWKNGYEGTSVGELVEASKLNTRSMYNLFGDKKGLFHSSLDHYREKFLNSRIEILKKKPGLEGVQALFDLVAESNLFNGCLFSNTLSESNVVDEESTDRAKSYFGALENQLCKNLRHAKRCGEFAGDVKWTSKFLVCLLQGMGIYFKQKPSVSGKKKIFETALKFIETR